MKKAIIFPVLLLIMLLSALFYCGKEIREHKPVQDKHDNNSINESFKQVGWINEKRYRAVIYVLSYEECKSSTREQIEEKIKFEAIKHLQKELTGALNRNQSARIKNLVDNYGIMIPDEIKCIENNIFYFDIEKNDLSLEFQSIKNIK